MNKTAIKNFAIWARNKLIADIQYRAGLMGITADEIRPALPQSTKETEFYDIGTAQPYAIMGEAVRQRKSLVDVINQKANETNYKTAYKYIIEGVAYTWFNRLIAVRFMEINDYFPSHIRVLSSDSGKMEPDLVTTPFDADLIFTDKEKQEIVRLKNENNLDECFRLLFIKQCNALNEKLPALFEKTADYTELLLNISVIDKEGVVYHLVNDISEDDFNIEKGGQVEIIGWLYQYYNTEPKNEAFSKNGKITKEEIPAVTQLFTPDWIVRYMVENSLGRLWVEGHPNGLLKSKWKYYLEEAEQEPEVQVKLDEIHKEYAKLNLEDIHFIDPCMGSGHILVYAFDVLMQIYESVGYSQRDAARSILENNLYGLDIDDRAYQMAYFAVMMKARQYNRRILSPDTVCHVYSIQESNHINRQQLTYFGVGFNEVEKNDALNQIGGLLDTFKDAKEYGSILNAADYDWDLLRRFAESAGVGGQMTLDAVGVEQTQERLQMLIEIGEVMARKYEVVVTNPPYMGISNGNAKLSEYVKKNYPDSKSDLFAVFIERCKEMVKRNGYQAMITQHAWMFLSSYEKLRAKLQVVDPVNMAHLGARAFEEIGGEVVQTTSFVMRKSHIAEYKGTYCRLIEPTTQKGKEEMFLARENRYVVAQNNFEKIPGSPVAYWMSENILKAFIGENLIGNIALPKQGSTLGDNAKFIRLWYEVGDKKNKWFNCMKGGEYRKWYGNMLYYLDWENNGSRVKGNGRATIRSEMLLFKEGITWSNITSGTSSFRYMPEGFFFESTGSVCFIEKQYLYYLLAFLNTNICKKINNAINPTMHLQSGDVAKLPLIKNDIYLKRINKLVLENIDSCKADWDFFEISWDFKFHPFLIMKQKFFDSNRTTITTISDSFGLWKAYTDIAFETLKQNEEEINHIFIDIYSLHDELALEVEDKDITIRKADLGRDIRSFISYAIGCMFGRYSIDVEGLVYAGGDWDDGKYSSFIPSKDNIIPITDEEYFEDDILGLFCDWLKKVYGKDTLEENLDFIAQALDNKGNTSREIIRNYFIKDFYADHVKVYQKRPIYWLFDSGKQNGFKALIYLHRYNADTIGNLRVDYLHRMQRIYESEIGRMQDMIDHSTNSQEVGAAAKRKERLQKQLKECRDYDEKIGHLALSRIELDLDDGVKVNYEKVQTAKDGKKYQVLAKV
ncbi:MAG: BREX-1 system adenine-specific DNA-methyltransferase PglX [Lachnospiraceae bacterium]|nr:BREX-1 system adenine-specific DNA-methyltransferase PglX [Lachnospiraceae bacterium]